MTVTLGTRAYHPAPSDAMRRISALLGGVIVAVLVFDALVTLAVEVLYLPLYVDAAAVPFSAAVAALVNILLVKGMTTVSDRSTALMLPLLAWTFGFLVASSAGPGGDMPLGGDWRALSLLLSGLLPAGFYLYRRAGPPVHLGARLRGAVSSGRSAR